jgi:hypothetical protein
MENIDKWKMPEPYKGGLTSLPPSDESFASLSDYILPIGPDDEFKNLKPLEPFGFRYKEERK